MMPTGRGAFGRSGRLAANLGWVALSVLVAFSGLACRHAKPKPPAATDLAARMFTCGETPCDARTSYCEMLKTDYAPLPSTYTCRPLPDACRAADPRPADAVDCGCFPRTTRCDFCSRLERNGVFYFQRTCIGGH